MKQNIMKKWVRALRSGDYKQGQGALATRFPHKKTEFCCLGVLCDLAVKDGVDIDINKKDCEHDYDNETYYLPKSVMDWADLKSYNGLYYSLDKGSNTLAALNDEGQSFEKIATTIEKKWKLL